MILKRKKNNEAYEFPLPGELLVIPIISNDEGHEFLIDVNRRQITQMKCTYQERYQKTIIFARLDINGPPHDNPAADTLPAPILEQYNGKTINCPHLHLVKDIWIDGLFPCPQISLAIQMTYIIRCRSFLHIVTLSTGHE